MLLWCPPSAYGEDVSALVEGVKAAVKEKAPCWKLFHQQGPSGIDRAGAWVNWTCGKEGVVAYLYHEPSVEAAVKLFHEMRTAPVAAPGRAVDSYKFGDESFVSSFNPYSRSSYVFFRKGNIIVRIDSGTDGKATSARTLKNAVRFARLFVEQLSAPPNNDMHPTPHQRTPHES
jgi:hypothetical protein